MRCVPLLYHYADLTANDAFIQHLVHCGEQVGLQILPAALETCAYSTPPSQWLIEGNPVENLAAIINRTRDPAPAYIAALMGVPAFNSHAITTLCSNKFFQYAYAVQCGVPVLRTCHSPSSTYPPLLAQSFAQPVAKPCHGHGGQGVMRLPASTADNDASPLAPLSLPYENSLIQEQAGTPGKDVRVYVVGNRPIAAVLRTSSDDFRANFSLGASVQTYPVTPDLTSLIARLCTTHYFDYVGMDFLFTAQDTFVFNEIEDVVGARMLYATTDIDIAAVYMRHIAAMLRRVVRI